MTTTHDSGRALGRSRPAALWLYLLGAVGLGASALFGGGRLVLDPTGDSMEMSTSWLDGTPFADYLVPGAVLFSLFGVGSVVVVYGVVRRTRWAWHAAVGLGAAQVGWIVVQVALLRTVNVLHVVYGGLGALLVALALTSAVRAALRPPRDAPAN